MNYKYQQIGSLRQETETLHARSAELFNPSHYPFLPTIAFWWAKLVAKTQRWAKMG